MNIGMIGLGKMGMNMAQRLMNGGHEIIATDIDREVVQKWISQGGKAAYSVSELLEDLPSPRTVWVMVPSGAITDTVIKQLSTRLSPGDTVIDGGNSNYKDSIHNAEVLKERDIHFMDVGTSGGIWGLKEGYSLMIGGEKDVVERHRSLFETLAPAADRGWGHVGPVGAGHFVKMIHNGIEYGMMQAYAEGFDILHARKDMQLDLAQVAEIWRYGSVVRSWLLDLSAAALKEDQEFSDIAPWVPDSGEGRWTVFEAIDLDVPAPVITTALQQRLSSRDAYGYAHRLLSALRNQFGGHAMKKES